MARSSRKLLEGNVPSFLITSRKSKQKSTRDPAAVQSRETSHLDAPAEGIPTGTRASTRPVSNKLRFTTAKPRKKLMYKDLLPNANEELFSRPRFEKESTQSQSAGRKRGPSKKKKASEEDSTHKNLIVDLVSEGDDDLSVAMVGPRDENNEMILRESVKPFGSSATSMRSPSPLFVSQSPDSRGIVPSQKPLEGDFEHPLYLPLPIKECDARQRTALLPSLNHVLADGDLNVQDTITANNEVTETTDIGDVSPNLTFLDQRLLQRTAVVAFPAGHDRPQRSPNQRTFRRILSENDSHPQRIEVASPSVSPHQPAKAIRAREQQALHQPRKPFRSPTKVQRSVSDTTHLVQRAEAAERRPSITPAAVEASFDPWSEPEAYLLFDWWPPGKEKPSFGMDE
jgi:hypothetical protein